MRLSGARIVHAHNLNPTLGWRALAAARGAGARVVLHLHQYRLVCAIGVCFTRGAECTRCHGRNTLPGVRLNCRGSLPEAVAYGAALSLWQRRLTEQADAVIVPSVFARERLRELGAPLTGSACTCWPRRCRSVANKSRERPRGSYALIVSRLAPEKGVDVAIDACRAGGHRRSSWPATAPSSELCRPGRRCGRALRRPCRRRRAGAAARRMPRSRSSPSRSAETFGMAAAEAMAAGLPVAASRVGALPELIDEQGLVPAGDPGALAQAIARLAEIGRGARAGARPRAVRAGGCRRGSKAGI